MTDSEPFYASVARRFEVCRRLHTLSFGHPDAYGLCTGYAAKLEKAGLADRFPSEADVRHIAIELLAERYAVEEVVTEPALIDESSAEARVILQERR